MKKVLVITISLFTIVSCSDSKQSETATSENQNMPIENEGIKDEPANDNGQINRLEFSIDIKAENEKIWDALWDDKHYRDWSGIFGEGSHYVVEDWNEGSTIMFLDSDQNGIYSIIEKHVPNETIQFKHIGMVVNGEKQPIDEEVKKWTGVTESYTLQAGSGFCTLLIEIDILDEHVEFMSAKLPVALEKIKKTANS